MFSIRGFTVYYVIKNVYYAIEEIIKVKYNVYLTWITITNMSMRSRENQRNERKTIETIHICICILVSVLPRT